MTAAVWRALTLLGLVVVAVGLYLGLATLAVPAINGAQDCGSVFRATHYATDGTGSAIVGECDSKRNDRKQVVWAMLAGGGVVAVVSGLASLRASAADRSGRAVSHPAPTVEP